MINYNPGEIIEIHSVRFLRKYFLCIVLCSCISPISVFAQKIVVDDSALILFNSLHSKLTPRWPSFRSDPKAYYDSADVDDKLIPFLIRELVRENDQYAIYGKSHYLPTPEDDHEWLERALTEIKRKTIPRFVSLRMLAETNAGIVARRTGFAGTEEVVQWLNWWEDNKHRFALTFKDAGQFDVGRLYYGGIQPGFLRCKSTNGLLDLLAGGRFATYQEVIESAAAAAGIRATVCISRENIGQHDSIIVDPVIDFREMTFDEFAFAITHLQVVIPLRKQGDTYYFGSCDPALGE